MRTRSTARRSIALLATTALMTGGVATGMLASPAYAAPGDQPVVSTVTPSVWDNRTKVTVTVTGQNFSLGNANQLNTSGHDTVILRPASTLTGPEVGDISVLANSGSANNTTSLTATFNLAMAPPGKYVLLVKSPSPSNLESAPTAPNFEIFSYGPASSSTIFHGVGVDGQDPTGFGLDCDVTNNGCGRGSIGPALDITGSNFAVGAKVSFLKPGSTTDVDTGLTFYPGNPSNGKNSVGTSDDTGYPNTSLIQGQYTYANDATQGTVPGFTPGLHTVRVVNTDGNDTGSYAATFAQPWFPSNGVSPTSIGAGAGANGTSPVTLTINGQGIRAGSSITVQSKATNTCSDVSVGASSVSNPDGAGTFSTISAPVTLPTCSATGARSVSIDGPDGATFNRSGILTVTTPPQVTSLQSGYAILGQGAHVGFGGTNCSNAITITGTGFQGGYPNTDPAKMTTFTFGPGVTVTTCAVGVPSGGASTTAQVAIDVTAADSASPAPVGDRVATAINPDGGSKTTARGTIPTGQSSPLASAPLAINAGPRITSVSPASFPTTTSIAKGVTITGTGFNNVSSSTAQPTLDISPSGITVSAGPTRVSDTQITFSGTTTNAQPGLRDVTITKADDHGRAVCVGCLGVDSLDVTKVNGSALFGGTPQAANDSANGTVLTLRSEPLGLDKGASAAVPGGTVTLTRQVPLAGQDPIVGTGLTVVDGDTINATFALLDAAPGLYNVRVVPPASVSSTAFSCTGCFLVTGAAMTTTKLEPAQAGQGATGVPVTLTGTHFSHGITIHMPQGVTVHPLTFVDTTKITFLVDIDKDAPVVSGSPDATVTIEAGDGTKTTNLTFAITPRPTPTTVAPTAFGQGAGTNGSTVTLTVGGAPGTMQDGIKLDLGPDITTVTKTVTHDTSALCTNPIQPQCNDDTMTATLVIAQDAVQGKRDVTLVNPDKGTDTLPQAFTVNPGPKITAVANENGQPFLTADGAAHSVSFLGTGFATTDPKTVLSLVNLDGTADPGIQVANPVVTAGKITADVTVATTAALAARRITLSNSGDKGYGSCDTCVAVAKVPGAVSFLTLVSGGRSVTANWGAAGNNGSPVSGYKLSLFTPGSATPTLAGTDGNARTYTFGNLVNGVTYTVSIVAVNGVGSGPATTKSAVAGLPSALSVTVSPSVVVYGSTFVVSGKLTSNGVGVGGKTLILTFVPSVGSSYVRTVTTVASGTTKGQYRYQLTSPYTVRVKAQLVPNDATYRPIGTSYVTEPVRVRVLKTAPASSSKSGSTTTLTITGNVGPNKKGTYAYLYRIVNGKNSLMQRVVISSTSTFTFSLKPGKGTYTMHVFVPTTVGNAANYSSTFTLYRV